ncbi:probable purine permease 4 [Malania oleifera]|uniref:probable purine permease 4 n=1 Tax=Malania oleifera TaxID=397392 RepID=UPI0025ADAD42|nr:probable purine permease 4 [Malania oleifera]
MNSSSAQSHEDDEQLQYGSKFKTHKHYILLLAINYLFLFVGSVSSSLLCKYYFVHKGSSLWVSTWVQSAGFPVLALPIYLPYFLKCTNRRPFSRFTPNFLALSLFVGIMLGLNNFLFSLGSFYLPLSTSSLLLSSQLAFTLLLSALIVKQKITFSNLNCVILLTSSAILLGLITSNDRPAGLTHAKYLKGLFSTVGAGLLFALYLPVMEKVYRTVYCYAMVVEMQLVMQVAATVFASVGMAVDGGFHEMVEESRRVFDKGETVYWVVLVSNVITWQMCFLGTAGMVFLTTGITGGICMTALTGMNVVAGVVAFKDQFGGVKAMATVLCGWGFCSYVYGMYVKMKEERVKENMKMMISEHSVPAMEMSRVAVDGP